MSQLIDIKKNHIPPFPLIEIMGPPFERGEQYGRLATSRIEKSIALYSSILSNDGITWEAMCDEARRFVPTIEIYSREYLEEMKGIAKGAGVDFEAILLVNARTEILYGRDKPGNTSNVQNEGCTTVVAMKEATQNGHVLQGQNWDWKEACVDTTLILHIKKEDGPDILTLVEAGGLARHGLNSDGIGVGANFLHTEKDFGSIGIPLGLIRRRILDSTLYYDALKAVIEPKRAFSNNMMISTAEGESICLETTPEEVFWVYAKKGLMVHSNHFLSPEARYKYKDLKVILSPDTLYRHRRVDNILRPKVGNITEEDIKTALFDDFGSPRSVCRPPVLDGFKDANAMTVAMIIMDLNESTMSICAAPHENREFVKYSLDMRS